MTSHIVAIPVFAKKQIMVLCRVKSPRLVIHSISSPIDGIDSVNEELTAQAFLHWMPSVGYHYCKRCLNLSAVHGAVSFRSY